MDRKEIAHLLGASQDRDFSGSGKNHRGSLDFCALRCRRISVQPRLHYQAKYDPLALAAIMPNAVLRKGMSHGGCKKPILHSPLCIRNHHHHGGAALRRRKTVPAFLEVICGDVLERNQHSGRSLLQSGRQQGQTCTLTIVTENLPVNIQNNFQGNRQRQFFEINLGQNSSANRNSNFGGKTKSGVVLVSQKQKR